MFSLGLTGPVLAQRCPPTTVSHRTPPGPLRITQPSNQMLIPRGVLAAACHGRCARELPRRGSRPPAAGLRRVCAVSCAPPHPPPSHPSPPTLPGLLSAQLRRRNSVLCGHPPSCTHLASAHEAQQLDVRPRHRRTLSTACTLSEQQSRPANRASALCAS